ncbi:IclR family transcriptional regulator [Williamsia sp. SKLECPSW1]
MTSPANTMRSLDRALDVLSTLQSTGQPLRLSEVAREAGLHIATAQRILNVLLLRGYASRSGDGYTAGPAALAIAHAFVMTNPISVLAQPILQQLATTSGLTASLYVRVEFSRVLVGRVEGTSPLSYVLPIGDRLPLHLGGAGKTFLAEMAPDELALALDGVDAVHHSDGSRVDRDGLMSQLETIRSDGYAVSVSERLVGIVSVTAPVRDPTGSLAAVLGLTGSESELTPDVVSRLSTEVRRAASSLGSRLPRGRG